MVGLTKTDDLLNRSGYFFLLTKIVIYIWSRFFWASWTYLWCIQLALHFGNGHQMSNFCSQSNVTVSRWVMPDKLQDFWSFIYFERCLTLHFSCVIFKLLGSIWTHTFTTVEFVINIDLNYSYIYCIICKNKYLPWIFVLHKMYPTTEIKANAA